MKYAIGIMSGTSFDGLDVAYAKIEGHSENTKLELIKFKVYEYDENFRTKLKKACNNEMNLKELCSFNFEIAIKFAEIINQFIKQENLDSKKIDFIASHGQTIYHLPKSECLENNKISTLQFGDGSVIANLTNIDVVSNFRTADMSVGGNGAPIVCYSEFILFRKILNNKKIIMQNIGGIANSTLLDDKIDQVIGFDNGPGNVLINYFAKKYFQVEYDESGVISSKGAINKDLLAFLLKDNYYQQKPPKTTGREKYSQFFLDSIEKNFSNVDKYDFLRTLTHLTAKIIIDSYIDFLIDNNQAYVSIISGGGAYNQTLIDDMKKLAPKNLEIKLASELKINIEAKEALAMIVLANQTLNRLSSNIPSATGACKKVVLGQISYK